MRYSLRAVHVHHGISSNANQWADFCEALCKARGIPFSLERVDISPYRRLGIEGAARRARYDAYQRHEADFVLLAQHRDDQVETILLNLARGAGARGLGGMPSLRSMANSRAKVLRPFLDVSRDDIEAHARAENLRWVEDESNDSEVIRRNFLRARILPELEKGFPEVRASLVRSARYLAEAGTLLDQLADADLEAVEVDNAIDIARLLELGRSRAWNVLRRWCEQRFAPWPGSARLAEVLRQAKVAGPDSVLVVSFEGWAFRRFQGRLFLDRQLPSKEEVFREVWRGERFLPLVDLGGVLHFRPEMGRGLSVARLRTAEVCVRLRMGGERIRLQDAGHRRTLKNLLRERGVPPWVRQSLPLVFCGDELVAVPFVGEAVEWRAGPEEAGLIVSWEPFLPVR